MFANFREQMANKKFGDEGKAKFLEVYAETGLFTYAAGCAGVSYKCVQEHLKKDPIFGEAFELAKKAYGDLLQKEIHRRAVEGVESPIINYRDNCVVPGVKERKFSDKLLELHVKRHVPEYRDRLAIEASVNAGVLVVTSPGNITPEEWAEKFNKKKD